MRGQGLPLNTIIIAIIVIIALVVIILIFTGQSTQFVESTSHQCRLAGGTCAASCSTGRSVGTLGCESGVCCVAETAAAAGGGAPGGGGSAPVGSPIVITAPVPADASGAHAMITTPAGTTREVTLTPQLAGTDAPITARAISIRTYRGEFTETDAPGDYAVEVYYTDVAGAIVPVRTYTVRMMVSPTRLAFVTAYPREGGAHDDVRISAAFGGEPPIRARAVIHDVLGEEFVVPLQRNDPLIGRIEVTPDTGGLTPGDDDGLDRLFARWNPPQPGTYRITIEAETEDTDYVWAGRASFTRGSTADFAPRLIEARDLVVREGERARPAVRIQFPNHEARVFVDLDESYELSETAVHGGIFREFTGSIDGLRAGTYAPTVRVAHLGGVETFSEAFTIEIGADSHPEARLAVNPTRIEPGEVIEFKATGVGEADSVLVHVEGPEQHTVTLGQREHAWMGALWSELKGGSYVASLEIDGRSNQDSAPFVVEGKEPELVSLMVIPTLIAQGGWVQVRASVRYPLEPIEAVIEGENHAVRLSPFGSGQTIPGEPVVYEGAVTLDEPGNARIRIRSDDRMIGDGVVVEVVESIVFEEPMVLERAELSFASSLSTHNVELGPILGEYTDSVYYDGEVTSAQVHVTHAGTRYTEPGFIGHGSESGLDFFIIESFINMRGAGVHEMELEIETDKGVYAFERGTFTVVDETAYCSDSTNCEGACLYDWFKESYACSPLCGEEGEKAADADSCCDGLRFDGEFCSQPSANDRFTLVFAALEVLDHQIPQFRSAALETADRFSRMVFPMCSSESVELIMLEELDCGDFCPPQFGYSRDRCRIDANACVSRHVAEYDLAMIVRPETWQGSRGEILGFCSFHSRAGFVSLESRDVVGTTLHEMGHCFGLGHLSCGPEDPPAGFCGMDSNREDCRLEELGLEGSMIHTHNMIMSYCETHEFGPVGLEYIRNTPRIQRVIDAC